MNATDITIDEIKPHEASIWAKVDRGTKNACWEWKAYRENHGYGQLSLGDGRRVLAHRAVFMLVNGPIPRGLSCCHRCDNPGCVNPSHLFIGTHRDNMVDRQEKGRTKGLVPGFAGEIQRAKTHCPHGHQYSPDNTRWRRGGGRACRTCERDRCRRYQAEKRAGLR